MNWVISLSLIILLSCAISSCKLDLSQAAIGNCLGRLPPAPLATSLRLVCHKRVKGGGNSLQGVSEAGGKNTSWPGAIDHAAWRRHRSCSQILFNANFALQNVASFAATPSPSASASPSLTVATVVVAVGDASQTRLVAPLLPAQAERLTQSKLADGSCRCGTGTAQSVVRSWAPSLGLVLSLFSSCSQFSLPFLAAYLLPL